ncbi:MAG: hypothetical protein ABGZ24_10060, partial [Fuerstiella sp.]
MKLCSASRSSTTNDGGVYIVTLQQDGVCLDGNGTNEAHVYKWFQYQHAAPASELPLGFSHEFDPLAGASSWCCESSIVQRQ